VPPTTYGVVSTLPVSASRVWSSLGSVPACSAVAAGSVAAGEAVEVAVAEGAAVDADPC
jgi:hypothetical protein